MIRNLIEDGEIGEKPEIFISNIAVAEFEHKTNVHKEIGFISLRVLKELINLHEKGEITFHIVGNRPSREEITYKMGWYWGETNLFNR